MKIKHLQESCGQFFLRRSTHHAESHNRIHAIALLFTFLILTACGGSGGTQNDDANTATRFEAAAVASALPAGATSIDDFNRTIVAPWTFWSPGLGATGSVTSTSDGYGSARGLLFNYNFACVPSGAGSTCGQYVAAIFTLPNPITAGAAVAFITKSAPNVQLALRVIDESGQTLQYRAKRPLEGYDASTWYQAVVALDKPSSYWGGINNGVIQGKIKTFWLIVDQPKSYPITGTVSIDNLAILSDWTAPGPLSPANNASSIDNFEDRATVSPWTFWGEGGTGAQGSISLGSGYESARALALNYNLSCVNSSTGTRCGQYATAILSLSANPIPVGAALSFMTKSSTNIQLVVRVIDQSGQTLQYRPTRPADGTNPNNWIQTVINLSKPEMHWGGINNGVVQNTIKALWIAAADPATYPAAGTLFVDNIAMLSNLNAPYPAGSVNGAVSIDNFQNRSILAPWTFWNSSGAGTTGSLSSINGYGSTRAVGLNYNFTCTSTSCGKSAAAIFTLPQPVFAGAALSVMTKSPFDVQFVIRVIDQSGQTLQYRPVRPLEAYDATTWHRAVATLNKPETYWGGANNGIVQGQVNSIWIIADNPTGNPTAGTLAIDNVTMLSQWNPPATIAMVNGIATIDDFENRATVTPWRVWSEGGFGATGTVTSIAGYKSSRALALNYNLHCLSGPGTTNCGQYVAAAFTLPQPAPAGAAISFRTRSTPDIQLSMRAIDQSGQTLQYSIERPLEVGDPAAWYQVIVPLGTPTSYWGGANNGIVQGKINAVWIIAGSPQTYPTTGSVTLDNLAVLSSMNGQYSLDLGTSSLFPVPVGAENLGSRIGVAYHSAVSTTAFASARSAGISFIRADLFWSWIETTPGVYNFSIFDRMLSVAEENDLGLLFILGYGNPLYDVKTPNGVAAFAKFAQAAATYFAGRNVRFEIWNEPDIQAYWGLSTNPVQQYAALCKAATAAIHLGNPAALVTTGGISWFDFNYLTNILTSGAAESANAIGVHGYRNGHPETFVSDLISANWRVRQALGKNLPIWNTEWGYSLGTIPGDGHSASFRKRQAILLSRQMLSQWMLNVPVAVWFDLVDGGNDPNSPSNNYGLLDSAYVEKPAIQSLRTLTSLAQGRSNKGLISNGPPGLHVIKLESTLDTVFIAWNSLLGTTITVDVPSAGVPTVVDYVGASVAGTLSGSRIAFAVRETDGPIYIRYRK